MKKDRFQRLALIATIAGLISISFCMALIPRLLPTNAGQGDGLHVRVGVYENAPKVFTDENGDWVGFWPDIVEYMAGEEGWIIEYVEGNFTEGLNRVKNKTIDIMVDVAFAEERITQYNCCFNNVSVFTNWGVVYANDKVRIHDFGDLNNTKIAVWGDSIHTTGAYGIRNLTGYFGLNCTYLNASSYTQVLEMVGNKTADAGVVNRLFGLLNKDKYDVVETSVTFNPSELKFAFPNGSAVNDILIPRIDYHINALQADGDSIYYQSINRYFLSGVPVIEVIPDWLIALIITVTIVGIVSITMSIKLKRNVDQKNATIDERDQIEDRLRTVLGELSIAKEAAEESDRLKSAFLATMSHELRTPLNSIIGFTGILQQEMVGPLNDEQKKQLGMVRNSSSHLLNLINDVLDLSKIEAGQMKTVIETFDLCASIEKCVRTVQPQADKKGIATEVDIEPCVGPITSDQRRVEQIILNLLSNAVKFTEKGKVRIECLVDEASVSIRVIDTGIGIKKTDADKLFKPFRQIDTNITRKYEGTGLGLSICKKLIDMLGGNIWVESEFGKGSTFAFTLPVVKG
ncbi:MAG: transporter substrate-binding domain-containing protein [Candidatus Lokiarchaeota archaeon]|nr:transporter substrate-binding domain-containing protein [Candidatus Lokiarchaeota archaeon]